jgi:hypothetical protein
LGLFCSNYAWYFMPASGAPLLNPDDGLSPFCATATLVRKSFCVTGLCGSAVLLLSSAVRPGVGNLAGIVAPVVTGFIVEGTGEFYFAFV